MEGLVPINPVEFGVLGALIVVIIALLYFGKLIFDKQAAAIDNLTAAINKWTEAVSSHNNKIETIETNQRRLEDKFDRLREDILKLNYERSDKNENKHQRD